VEHKHPRVACGNLPPFAVLSQRSGKALRHRAYITLSLFPNGRERYNVQRDRKSVTPPQRAQKSRTNVFLKYQTRNVSLFALKRVRVREKALCFPFKAVF
jgi:hypothetical protein